MNLDLLHRYINAYEQRFDAISHDEIYKWRAVQWFQRHWNIEAVDFTAMLEKSLKKTSNLMDSGYYYPHRMILLNAERDPEAVRAAFRALFDEELDLMDRITSFQAVLGELTERSFPGKKSYQDDRAVMVYLALRYPNTYYLYKSTMFKEFTRKLGYDYKPKWETGVNIIPYLNLCARLREEIIQHDSLLKRHSERIGPDEYVDKAYHLLTQDFIYAVTKYLTLTDEPGGPARPRMTLIELTVEPRAKTIVLKGSFTDFTAQQQHRAHIGNLGEELVFQVEKQKHGAKVRHTSRIDGNGLGYDILSVGDDGGPLYIEVKTTQGGAATPFFVTANELKKSKVESERYCLYRLYNFDNEKWSADYYTLRGDLSHYCTSPTQYEVNVTVDDANKAVVGLGVDAERQ